MMFIKFSVLLLAIILSANNVLGVSDDDNKPDEDEEKILKDLFDDCRRWLGTLNSVVSSGGFWKYIGKKKSDLSIMRNYYNNNPNVPIDFLELKHFSELIKYICSSRGVTLKYWAAYKKSKAALRTRDDATWLLEDPTEDNILAGSDDGKTESEILEDSFDNCRSWLDKSEDNSISLSEFWVYMGKNDKDCDRISEFFKKHPEAHFRISEYYIDNPDVIQGPIDLKLYSDIFKHICGEIGVSVREWAAYREIKTAARTPRDVISLPRGDHEKAL